MGKDIKGKEFGVGISRRSDGFYVGRFTIKYGNQSHERRKPYKIKEKPKEIKIK